MRNGVSLKNVPTVVWYCLTLAFLGVVAAFVILSVTGTDSTEFRSFLNTVLNFASLLVGGGGLVFAGVAAKNSEKAAEQTNGALDRRIEEGARKALLRHNFTKNQEGDDGRPTV